MRLRWAVACPRSHSEEEQGLSRGYLRVKSPHGAGKVMEPTQRSSRAVGRLAKQSFWTIPVFSEGAPEVRIVGQGPQSLSPQVQICHQDRLIRSSGGGILLKGSQVLSRNICSLLLWFPQEGLSLWVYPFSFLNPRGGLEDPGTWKKTNGPGFG